MAWNEPGNNSQDPWGNGNKKRPQNGPPDLDEALKNMQKKINGFFGGSGGSGGDSNPSKGVPGFLIVVVVIALLVFYAIAGFYTVDEKEKAVVLRLGSFSSIHGAGLHWNAPFIDEVQIIQVTNVRTYKAGNNKLMLTEDESIVRLPVTVQYRIDDLKSYVLQIREPDVTLQHSAESVLRHVVGSTELNSVLSSGRQQMADEMKERLQNYLNRYKTGIHVISVNIDKGRPPEGDVQKAFDDVIAAKEEYAQLINQAELYRNEKIPVEKGKREKTIQEAKGYKERVIVSAQGEADRFVRLLAEYQQAPEVTRDRLYLDSLQNVMSNTPKVLIDVEQGNNLMYLPLDKIMQTTNAQDNTRSSTNEQSTSSKTTERRDINDSRSGSSRESLRGSR